MADCPGYWAKKAYWMLRGVRLPQDAVALLFSAFITETFVVPAYVFFALGASYVVEIRSGV
jgi:hypothetical protein